MTKKYSALVMEIDEIVEEAVVLLVNGVIVQCFINYCPFKIEVGKTYEVEFEMVLPDSVGMEVSQDEYVGVEMEDDSFSCVVAGYLDGAVLRSFIDFDAQDIHYDYPFFNQKFIKINVIRIDVAF
ncbi:hypothetical protein MO767_14310 [Pseudomonas sp. UYIF39]|jgi:hypothetical protein|uniref:hypothetical protein n=1 Tax=Pseudomonas sp. UYIF39 TaxID=1630747 RepID=UPI00249EE2C6|nr:hypothetical protein [Pseudomonas sp. UYIF39]MDI3355518.1 hypothetical protein [Pseudomonas sp. UYIF39]